MSKNKALSKKAKPKAKPAVAKKTVAKNKSSLKKIVVKKPVKKTIITAKKSISPISKKVMQKSKPAVKKKVVAQKKSSSKKIVVKKGVVKPIKKVISKAKPTVAKKTAVKKPVEKQKSVSKKIVAKKSVSKNLATKAAKNSSVKTSKKPVKVVAPVVEKSIKQNSKKTERVSVAKKTIVKPVKKIDVVEKTTKKKGQKEIKISQKNIEKTKDTGKKTISENTLVVPRDEIVRENANRSSFTSAYNIEDLERLIARRGTMNINLYDPLTAKDVVKAEKPITKQLKVLPKGNRNITAVSVADILGYNPFSKGDVSEEEKSIPAKWQKYYKKLIERKKEIQSSLSKHSHEAFKSSNKEDSGDLSAFGQHTADITTEAFDRDVALSRISAEQEELTEIEIAIERMKKGTYGICEYTGKKIPEERLRDVPFTRYTLEGKIEAEKERKQEARRRATSSAIDDFASITNIDDDIPINFTDEANSE